MRCFVTVGSTEFDALIAAVMEPKCLRSLKKIGVNELLIQMGSSRIELEEGDHYGVDVNFYRYKNDILPDIIGADLIIGHGGSGTCLEVLSLRKPFVVVINEDLMDNHQWELAERFAELGYVICTIPTGLAEILQSSEIFHQKQFVGPNYAQLTKIITQYMRVVD